MKIIAINGSPKAKGNTYHSLVIMGEEFAKLGIEMEIIHVGHKAIHGCIGCGRCAELKSEQCPSFPNDIVNETVQKMKAADGIILGSPVYYSGVAGTMKCFLDRAFYVGGVNGGLFKHKIGAAISVQRRTGGSSTLDCLNHYLLSPRCLSPRRPIGTLSTALLWERLSKTKRAFKLSATLPKIWSGSWRCVKRQKIQFKHLTALRLQEQTLYDDKLFK